MILTKTFKLLSFYLLFSSQSGNDKPKRSRLLPKGGLALKDSKFKSNWESIHNTS